MTRFMKAMMAAVVVAATAGTVAAQPPAFPGQQPVPFPSQPVPIPQQQPVPDQQWKLGVKISANNGGGLMIHEVFAGSPAEQAGLRAGMVLLTVDGVLYDDPAAARDKVMFNSGDNISLVYMDQTGCYRVTAQLATTAVVTTMMMMEAGDHAPKPKAVTKAVPQLKNLKRVAVPDPRKK